MYTLGIHPEISRAERENVVSWTRPVNWTGPWVGRESNKVTQRECGQRKIWGMNMRERQSVDKTMGSWGNKKLQGLGRETCELKSFRDGVRTEKSYRHLWYWGSLDASTCFGILRGTTDSQLFQWKDTGLLWVRRSVSWVYKMRE